MKLKALIVVTIFSFSFYSHADCPDQAFLKIEGVSADKSKVLVSNYEFRPFEYATKNEKPTFVSAYIYEFSLDEPQKPNPKLKVSYNEKNYGQNLKTSFLNTISKLTEKDFPVKDTPIVSGKTKMTKDKGYQFHSSDFADLRNEGGKFRVERQIQLKKYKGHFELLYFSKSGSLTPLSRDLLKGSTHNQAGIDPFEIMSFVGNYVLGVSHYCGEPVVWSYKLKFPYKGS